MASKLQQVEGEDPAKEDDRNSLIGRLEQLVALAKGGVVVGVVGAAVERDGTCTFVVGGLAAD